jgi:hypothetical protein
VWLETSAESNVRFYRRFGFAVVGVVDLRGGGPRTWLMLRQPRPADGLHSDRDEPGRTPSGL